MIIMGIVNVTPDSFSDGGRYFDVDRAVQHGMRLRADGAGILDVGGESTRPGAVRVGLVEEQRRVLPVIAELAASGAVVSIDTMHAETAAAAVGAGARIVNDVSGGLADPDMLVAVAASGVEYAIGHWRGHSADMYARAEYVDPAAEVAAELAARLAAAQDAGIPSERLIVDPGIGFGKRGDQNWAVLRGLDRLTALGARVLVGTSRKRFLTETLEAAAEPAHGPVDQARRDLATAVTSVLAARAGAWGVRVHDVAATRDALRVAAAWDDRIEAIPQEAQ